MRFFSLNQTKNIMVDELIQLFRYPNVNISQEEGILEFSNVSWMPNTKRDDTIPTIGWVNKHQQINVSFHQSKEKKGYVWYPAPLSCTAWSKNTAMFSPKTKNSCSLYILVTS
jgi:hypothetical protein